MTPPKHEACSSPEMLPGCAEQFGSLHESMTEQGKQLLKIAKGIESLLEWRAGMEGAAGERDRMKQFALFLVGLFVTFLGSSVTAAVLVQVFFKR